jgi:peptidoglycan hydrolase CwlO-like protein
MTKDHELLEQHLKKTTIRTNIVSILVALFTSATFVYGFYYKTENTLQKHSVDINDVKSDVTLVKNKLNESAIYQGVTQAEIKALQDKVNGIDGKVDKMDDKLDKILLK